MQRQIRSNVWFFSRVLTYCQSLVSLLTRKSDELAHWNQSRVHLSFYLCFILLCPFWVDNFQRPLMKVFFDTKLQSTNKLNLYHGNKSLCKRKTGFLCVVGTLLVVNTNPCLSTVESVTWSSATFAQIYAKRAANYSVVYTYVLIIVFVAQLFPSSLLCCETLCYVRQTIAYGMSQILNYAYISPTKKIL